MTDSKISALTNYTPPIDTDVLPIVDITTSTTKKITWANIKATLKTYFDAIYQAILVSGTTIKTVNGTTLLGAGDLATPQGTVTSVSVTTANGVSGTVATATTTPAISLSLGAITPTSVNKVAITAPATGSTLTIADGKTLTVNNSITFAGTDATTITFQGTDTYVGRATTDTLTNKTLTTPTITKPVMSATNPTAQTYTPAAAGTATLDLSLSNQHFITMPAGNITIALSNDTNNQPFLIAITQDGVGSRTVTWPATIRWAGGTVPALTTTASKRDIFGLIRTGASTYDGVIIGTNI